MTSSLVLDPDALHDIMLRPNVDAKIAALQSLKSFAKRNPINLSYAFSYFETLRYVVESSDTQLHSLAHSCNGHLIKRIITQNPSYLAEILDAAVPIVIDGLADSKPSIRTSSMSVFKDIWMACPERVDTLIRDLGLSSSNPTVLLGCLDLLIFRITNTSNISFKPFTPPVVALLRNQNQDVRVSASKVLTTFFRVAREAAKEDLAKELANQGVDTGLAENILSSVNYTRRSVSPAPSSPTQSKALNIDFFLQDPRYEIEEFPAEYCHSLDNFRREITLMAPCFEGKETEANWTKREAGVNKLRGLLRGNIAQETPDQYCLALKELSQGIIKAASSLRTVLSTSACQLIKESFMMLGSNLDSISDIYLSATIKFASLAKRITSSNGMMAASAIVAKSSYSVKAINLIQSSLGDKNAQPRLFAAKLIRLELFCHRTIKSIVDSTGGREIMERCIVKGLADANTGVREEMRLAFWAYNELWPTQAASAAHAFDSSIRKGLERVNPTGKPLPSSGATKQSSRPQSGGLREFIMQSRERNSGSRTEMRQESIQSTSGPGPRPRLGMPQRSGVRRAVGSSGSNTSGSSSSGMLRSVSRDRSVSQSSLEESKIKSRSFNSTEERNFRSLQRSVTPEMPVSEVIVANLSSNQPSKTEAGAKLLLENLDNKANVPSLEVLSRTLHRLFINKRKDAVFQPTIYALVSDPKGLEYLSQVFSPTELALSVIYSCPSSTQGYPIVERVLMEVDPEKRLSLVTYLVSHRRDVVGAAGIGNDLYTLKFLEAVVRDCKSIAMNDEVVENIKLLTLYLRVDKDLPVSHVFDELKRDIGYVVLPENVPIPDTPTESRDVEMSDLEVEVEDAKDSKDSKDSKDAKDAKDSKDSKDAKVTKVTKEPETPVYDESLTRLSGTGFYVGENKWESFETQVHNATTALQQLTPSETPETYASLLIKLRSREISEHELNSLAAFVRNSGGSTSTSTSTSGGKENMDESIRVDGAELVREMVRYVEGGSMPVVKAKKVMSVLGSILPQDLVGQEAAVFRMVVKLQGVNDEGIGSDNREEGEDDQGKSIIVAENGTLAKYILMHGGEHLLGEINMILDTEGVVKMIEVCVDEILEHQLIPGKEVYERPLEMCYTYLNMLVKLKRVVGSDGLWDITSGLDISELEKLGQALARGLKLEQVPAVRKLCYMVLQSLAGAYRGVSDARTRQDFEEGVVAQLDDKSVRLLEYIVGSDAGFMS
ncbi:uncharacterized protein SAPINGB_P006119 [Magnusiomyces paraingens]|uniref:Protein STU1 n=1 Tax=Magnusiomyces paraingens TaxID=2606893 RepID=A0A5E8C3D9_9ASCO|nr:uncharacterized protein SAPINGB_P006119 [Saprochaete ingens]VVT58264.1 unnamed protein product [Saprochaete ingens]